jgi:RHS repeat-associated protein
MTLTVNNKNQVTTPAFSYDATGNLNWDTTHALNYDAEGHMTPVSGETYTYDGDGRRVLKSDGTVYWVDDQLRPLSVGTTSSSITHDYIFLGSQRIATVPLSSGNPYYYLSDHLGSTAVIASGDGKTIQWEADYFPFGAVRQVFTSTVGNNYEFTGYENDSETGYNYANARYDAGRWGRFLSPDPYLGSTDITNPQSLNRYSYVSNNPIGFVDPLGLATVCTLNGPGTNVHICVSIGCSGAATLDGQDCGGDSGGGSSGGGLNIGITGLPGLGSVPGTCLFAGACPSLPIAPILGSLPGMPNQGCDFGPCDDPGTQLGNDFVPGAHLWEYGNYCGKGGAGTPINNIDQQCKNHDDCYKGIGIDWTSMSSDGNFQKLSPGQQGAARACNQQLCDGLSKITPPWYNVSQNTAIWEITKYFHGHVPKGAQCH